MTQSIRERLEYHSNSVGRNLDSRLALIFDEVELSDTSVFDLGCSGGGFVFGLAPYVKKICGVDGDAEIIKNNIERSAVNANSSAIEFINETLSPEMSFLIKHDITIFLSVFHHMINGSNAYDWNNGSSLEYALKTVKTIRANTNVLVFEVGLPSEGYDWSFKLPFSNSDLHSWVEQNIFDESFEVESFVNPSLRGVVGSIKRQVLQYTSHGSRLASLVKRFLGWDVRDLRPIFIGWRKND
jgi:SAM-dependent methyltransferase